MINQRSPFFHPAIPTVLLAGWFLGLWILSSLSGDKVPMPHFAFADKVAHFTYFLGGGFLVGWILRRVTDWPSWRIALTVFLAIATVGAVDEIHQLFTLGRSGADVFDWLADVCGGFAGAWVFLSLYGFVTRTTDSPAPARN